MNIALRMSPPLVPTRDLPGSALARIDVFDDVDSAAPAWDELATADSVASPYQSREWVRLWQSHVLPRSGGHLLILVGRDATGAPLFVWPLVRGRLGPLRIAAFVGGKHATINMPLWRRDVAQAWTASDLHDVLRSIAARVPDLDLIILCNQPFAWHGTANPFALLPHFRATEDNFVAPLGLPGAQVVEREISSAMRSRLRNKERKLSKLPGYRYVRAQTPDAVRAQLDAFFAQKSAKLAAMGVQNVFAGPGIEDFVRAACLDGLGEGRALIELHALEADGEILALFSGINDGRRFTSNFNSHTMSEHARFSPGLILMQYMIANVADHGFESFDIGPGEAHYKSFFCKTLEPLFDSVIPLSPRGRLIAWPLRLTLAAKSAIKRNSVLWAIASRVRRVLRPTQAPTS